MFKCQMHVDLRALAKSGRFFAAWSQEVPMSDLFNRISKNIIFVYISKGAYMTVFHGKVWRSGVILMDNSKNERGLP